MAEQARWTAAARFCRHRRDMTWLEECGEAALTKIEVADVLHVDVRTVSRAIEDGQLPVIRIGRRVLIPRLPLLALLRQAHVTGHAGVPT